MALNIWRWLAYALSSYTSLTIPASQSGQPSTTSHSTPSRFTQHQRSEHLAEGSNVSRASHYIHCSTETSYVYGSLGRNRSYNLLHHDSQRPATQRTTPHGSTLHLTAHRPPHSAGFPCAPPTPDCMPGPSRFQCLPPYDEHQSRDHHAHSP